MIAFGIVLGILLVLGLVCLKNALSIPYIEPQPFVAEKPSKQARDYAEILSDMIQSETVSNAVLEDKSRFYDFHRKLEILFPELHEICEVKDFDGSLLYHWKGKEATDPILLMNHFDVVEASGEWTYPPFSGTITDDKVYGRGALDDKGPLFTMLQAVEECIREGYVPQHDIYIASSCTEEIGGDGSPKTAHYLKEQGIRFRFLVDEGGMVVDQPLAILKGTYAMVGVVEKGYGDLKFIARSSGGHASAPGKNTPLVRLGKFMKDVEDHYPFRIELSDAFKEMLRRFSPELPLAYRLVTANLWLFEPLIKYAIKHVPQLAAMTRTTVAFTTASGSEGYNVLPHVAYVTANVRYIPHQSNQESIAILSKIAAKYDVEVEVLKNDEPAPVVDFRKEPFELVETVIQTVYPDITVVPYIMTGGTDAKYYNDLTQDGIRFSPLHITTEQMSRIHGVDENVDIATLKTGVRFYKTLIRNI